jgi:hypothetical protein
MRCIFFLSFLICFSSIQGQNKYSCEAYIDSFDVKDYKIYPDFYFYEKLPNTSIRVYDFFVCLVNLANSGDQNAEKYLLKYLDEIYELTKIMHETGNTFHNLMNSTLGQLSPSKDAFDFLMKLFQDDRLYSEELEARWKKKVPLGDVPDMNYGLYVYTNIMQRMIDKDQVKILGKEFVELYGQCADKYPPNSNSAYFEKEVRSIWYKRIKSDWEAGKIKLRTDKE